MTIYNVLSLLISSGLLATLCGYFYKKIKENDKKTEAVCKGVQALLRDRLYQSYNHYKDKGFAPIYARENFENMWQQYHNLGMNGVMDGINEKFKDLPTERKEE